MSEDDERARAEFLGVVTQLERWLEEQQIPYSIIGSIGVAAHTDRGASLDLNRKHAFDDTQRIPDIDLLVPREAIPRVQDYAAQARSASLPLKVDTAGAQLYIDYRPHEPYSYLTHRDLNFPVRSELFEPQTATLFDHQIKTLDPHTLLHTFGTIGGVVRKKDVPKIEALSAAIVSGTAPTRFSASDVRGFDQYRRVREEKYPLFIRSKQAWEKLLTRLPPGMANAAKHYVMPPAQRIMSRINDAARGPSAGPKL